MSRTYADFLAERGVTLADLTTEQKLTMSDRYTVYLQTQTGNITSPHAYLSIPLLFNKLTPLFLLYTSFLLLSAYAGTTPSKGNTI
jgi:hypothetical protein